MFTKQFLRKKVFSRLASESPGRLRKKSLRIEKKLLQSAAFRKAGCICAYVSLANEVDTRAVIRKSLKLGKRVLVPLAHVPAKKLKLYEIKNFSKDLKKGSYGILEPRIERTNLTHVREADLVIVPGLVFDKKRNRIGRGAGFYDRFLKKVRKGVPKVGLAFRFQIVDKVPVERHDQRLDLIITD